MEIAQFTDPEPLTIAGRHFTSRLFVGTGKFGSAAIARSTIEASGTEMVTVALRRIDLNQKLEEQSILSAIDQSRIQLLPNTSGARNAEEAIRLARLARSMGAGNWVKLEVTPDPVYLLPDGTETLQATKVLVQEGFVVLPYIHADPVLALRLQDAGAATVMPLGSPIGSHQGIRTRESIAIILDQVSIPVVVDAGLGVPSHAAQAMEMGADAILVNTALATARDPVRLGLAFAMATQAGRMARLYGVAAKKSDWNRANPSSPLTGLLDQVPPG